MKHWPEKTQKKLRVRNGRDSQKKDDREKTNYC